MKTVLLHRTIIGGIGFVKKTRSVQSGLVLAKVGHA